MKDIILKCSAVAVLLMYVLSLGGINVHTCSHTGESFVTILAFGTSCQDIHPSHHHHHEGSCSCAGCQADHDCDGSDGCCSNDSHLLLTVGDDACHVEHVHVPFSHAFRIPESVFMILPVSGKTRAVPYFSTLPDASRPLFSVLRV